MRLKGILEERADLHYLNKMLCKICIDSLKPFPDMTEN